MAKTAKRNGLRTVFFILLVIIVITAVIGLAVRFTKGENPPTPSGNIAVKLNDDLVESGASVGLLESGLAFTVVGTTEYDVKIHVYSTGENDFTLTVGEEPYTWGDFDGRNVTAGFDLKRTNTGFTLKHYGLNEIISRVQNGMTVKADEFPPLDIFRMAVKAEDLSVEIYFRVNAMVVDIEIDNDGIVF